MAQPYKPDMVNAARPGRSTTLHSTILLVTLLAIILAMIPSTSALAEASSHDMANMSGAEIAEIPGMDDSSMPGMDHSGMSHSGMAGMDHAAMGGTEGGSKHDQPSSGCGGTGGAGSRSSGRDTSTSASEGAQGEAQISSSAMCLATGAAGTRNTGAADAHGTGASDSHGTGAEGHGHGDPSAPLDTVTVIFTLLIGLLLIGASIIFFRGMDGTDLMEYSLVKKLAKSKMYPAILQIPTLIFFGFIGYYLFFGSSTYSQNPGSILSWTLWWPLVPITFIMMGRLWCAICPFPLIGNFLQKFVQPVRKPGKFLMDYGIWIMDGFFIGITLFDRLYGMVDTPWLSGLVFLFLTTGIIIISLRYERNTFCKHVCFLGGVSGNYSMVSGMTIESKDKKICAACKAKACYFGSGTVEGCPYGNVMPSKQGMRNCTLCAKCIKACPHDNIAVRVRSIASELWSHTRVSFSESFFAKLMVGIVIIQNLGMLAVWGDMMTYLTQYGMGEKAAITILYFTAIIIPLGLMTLTSFLSNRFQSRPGGTAANFAAFGYAFIPIDVAGHIAHNLFHLLAEGATILGAAIGLFTGGISSVPASAAIASPSVINGLQYALIAAGGAGTLYVAYRIALAKEGTRAGAIKILWPHALLLFFIFAVNIYLFMTPMAHRGG